MCVLTQHQQTNITCQQKVTQSSVALAFVLRLRIFFISNYYLLAVGGWHAW